MLICYISHSHSSHFRHNIMNIWNDITYSILRLVLITFVDACDLSMTT